MSLSEKVGETVTIRGNISEIIWQHLVGPSREYPFSNYFDLEDGYQIVIYSKEDIKRKVGKIMEITGEVVEIKGQSKGINEDGTRDPYVEYHINVDKVKYIDEN